jgi:diguanylate cyclase (GGDEF)-like protein
MNPQRLAIVAAAVAVALSVLYLLGWWLLWRLLVTHPMPGVLVMPLTAVGNIVIAIGLVAAQRRAGPAITGAWALTALGLAGIVLLEYLLGVSGGLETYFFGDRAQALVGGSSPGRPAPQTALIMLFLGIALWHLGRPRTYRFDFADLGIGMSLFLSFAVLLGHLYQARALTHAGGSAAGMSIVETMILLLLSLGALSLNPQGVIASFTTDDAAGQTKRRVLPVVVLTPVLLGLIQYLAVKYQVLELSLALALTVTANIVVLVALTEWVGHLLVRIEQARSGDFAKTVNRAKEEGKTDMLTSLLNRRGWDEVIAQGEARCQREGLNACVIVIDLDGLKKINDTLGHAKGDEFIRRAGNALRLAARREDTLARLGGDEFAYLSIGCPPEHAGLVLKRLAQSLQKANVPASLGYAMRDLAGSIAGAFQEADHAMYQHKRARKGQPPPQQVA